MMTISNGELISIEATGNPDTNALLQAAMKRLGFEIHKRGLCEVEINEPVPGKPVLRLICIAAKRG